MLGPCEGLFLCRQSIPFYLLALLQGSHGPYTKGMKITCLITYMMEVTMQTQAHVRTTFCAGRLFDSTHLSFFRGAHTDYCHILAIWYLHKLMNINTLDIGVHEHAGVSMPNKIHNMNMGVWTCEIWDWYRHTGISMHMLVWVIRNLIVLLLINSHAIFVNQLCLCCTLLWDYPLTSQGIIYCMGNTLWRL